MSQQWFFSSAGKRCGPVNGARLKELAKGGQLQEDDLIWRDGLKQWVPAKTVKGLIFSSSSQPPPLPQVKESSWADIVDQAVEPVAETAPAHVSHSRSSPVSAQNVLAGLFACLVGGCVFISMVSSLPSNPANKFKTAAQFLDSPENFKGQQLKLDGLYRRTYVYRPEYAGSMEVALFHVGGDYEVVLDVPRGLKVPNLKGGDIVIFTFQCNKGDHMSGNTLVKIERP